MPHTAEVDIREASWADPSDRDLLVGLRFEVFVREQGVPEDMELDEDDEDATHFLATDRDSGEPIGSARLTATGKVTRMCVVENARGRGIGAQLLERTVERARELGHRHLHLHAQVHAAEFYERYGFVARGEDFMEAGIPHREMTRAL